MNMIGKAAQRQMHGNVTANGANQANGGMGNRWSDAARAVSLAVRQAKAARRRAAESLAAKEHKEQREGGKMTEDRGWRTDDGGPWMPRILRKWALQGAAGQHARDMAAAAAVGHDKALARSAAESLRQAKAARRGKG